MPCREESSRKQYSCWRAELQSPSREELRDLTKFNNAAGGPVPDEYELGYSIIAAAFPRGGFCAIMYIEIVGRDAENKRRHVRVTQLNNWFPRTDFWPSCDEMLPEQARDQCKMAGKWVEKGLISTARQAIKKKEAEKKRLHPDTTEEENRAEAASAPASV